MKFKQFALSFLMVVSTFSVSHKALANAVDENGISVVVQEGVYYYPEGTTFSSQGIYYQGRYYNLVPGRNYFNYSSQTVVNTTTINQTSIDSSQTTTTLTNQQDMSTNNEQGVNVQGSGNVVQQQSVQNQTVIEAERVPVRIPTPWGGLQF